MIVKLIREGLGRIIIFLDLITRPKKMTRTTNAQQAVDKEAQGLSLYQFYACPFCIKVRRALHRLNLDITLRDAQNDTQYRTELLEKGGRKKVPCLRIEENNNVKWMYESKDIIQYLTARFSS